MSPLQKARRKPVLDAVSRHTAPRRARPTHGRRPQAELHSAPFVAYAVGRTALGRGHQKGSEEAIAIEVDKALSKWQAIWRDIFVAYTRIALDLGSHPENRVVTHCMYLVVEPRMFEDDKAKQYRVVSADVRTAASVDVEFPALNGIVDDPTDFTQLRYVLVLQNYRGENLRVRNVQWNDRGLARWRSISPERSRALVGENGDAWSQALMYSVESMNPQEVRKMVGA